MMGSDEVSLVVLLLEDEGARLNVQVIIFATIQQGLCLLKLGTGLLRLLRHIVDVFLLICSTDGLDGSLLEGLSLLHMQFIILL